jgi:Na+-driven multidrug efflux pump
MRFLDRVLGGSVMSAQQILSLLFPLFLDQVFVRIISLLKHIMISSYGRKP